MSPSNVRQGPPITVRTPGASYPILIEEGLLARAGKVLENLSAHRKVFLLSDTTVWKLWGKKLLAGLKPLTPVLILTRPGERQKRLETVEKITLQLAAGGAERSSLLVAFGGGVVGDVGGFAASVFLRGIDCVQIPTTLVAQVDSAIGGKTGVNLTIGKNLVGTFCQPRMVVSDPLLLRTLPERELRAGLFEAIKCGVIGDPVLFELLWKQRANVLRRKPAALTRVIRACAALKAHVVSLDEKEGDLRRILNFGHTLGHALEAASAYRRFLHGEAVAWGMLAATRLAVEEKLLAPPEAKRIEALVVAYGPVPSLRNLSPESVAQHLAVDKKVRQGEVHFVLPCAIGKVKIVGGIAPQRAARVLQDLKRANPFGRKPQ
ncbi:MAG: 3-dehydroquinate synthase [Acidobacteria bacterium RIFCSPLOWO2_02_FULL_59_13]|nr:MAG: 3-dehydroquinate synthase [Acidobacteria bacterium RIFCSPLOWO2_02_FULL_59_13]